jgi:hypothetical protein
MDWRYFKNQRDENGDLTPMARAFDVLEKNGCDCDENEPGTCMACVCEAALRYQWTIIELTYGKHKSI